MDVPSILTELNEHGFSRYSVARQVSFLNEVYGDVCGRVEWPFLFTSATITFNTGTGVAPLASDTLRIIAVQDNVALTNLAQFSQREFVEKFSGALGATGGTPVLFYQPDNSNIVVWPAPTSNRALKVFYIKRPNVLTSTDLETAILIPPQFHRVLVEGTLAHLHTLAEREDLADVHRGRYENLIQNMKELLTKPQPIPVENPVPPTQAP